MTRAAKDSTKGARPAGDVIVAVDAMGGDRAPTINIDGSLEALAADAKLRLLLVGDERLLREEFARRKLELPDRLTLVHADEVISMEDHGAQAIRKKKGSSIHVGLRLVKEGEADAFISAGNSGAVMAGALLTLGRIADVERPAILIRLPTAEGFVTLLDAGANVDCKASHLVQFAEMGHCYMQIIEGMEKPRIAVLSNGSESHKGNDLTRATHEILSAQKKIHYLGYVEGYDLFRGVADVIVCDGFVGNVTLKLSEGLAESAARWFRNEIRRDVLGMVGVVFLKRILSQFRRKFDYQPYGAAPLLGIQGMVLISHGSSTSVAIRNGILTAKRGVEQKFVERIGQYLEKHRKA